MPPNEGAKPIVTVDLMAEEFPEMMQSKTPNKVEEAQTMTVGKEASAKIQVKSEGIKANIVDSLPTDSETLQTEDKKKAEESSISMELNEAFEALENMRKANLEVEFGHPIDHSRCVHCLRDLPPHKRVIPKSRFAQPKRHHKACLMCGMPTCKKHSSRVFRKGSKITICKSCAPIFSLDFIIESVAVCNDEVASEVYQQQVKHMVDVYDRVLLMLKYSTQYVDEIAHQLENSSRVSDRIVVGTSATGVMSGIAGVAGAAAIFTPAGPPLLIASLLFGGTAQAASTGTKTVNYYSTPRKLASRIIAYYNLCKSILLVTCVLRDALLKDHIDLENYVDNIVKEVQDIQSNYGYGKETYDHDDNSTVTSFTSVTEGSDSLSDDGTLCTVNSISMQTIDEHENGNGGNGSSLKKNNSRTDLSSEQAILQSNSSLADIDEARPSKGNDGDSVKSKSKKAAAAGAAACAVGATSSLDDDAVYPNGIPAVGSASSLEDDATTQQTALVKASSRDSHDKTAASARFISRASLTSSSLAGMASFAYMAGGALSLAHIAFEAKNMASTFKRMQQGSPCSRANTLRAIKEEIANFPGTNLVAEEWDNYLETIEQRRVISEETKNADEGVQGETKAN